MNQAHLELLASDDWRTMLRDFVLPFALDAMPMAELGPRVLEVGPGPGLTTDLLCREVEHVTAVELDPGLAKALAGRYDRSDRVTVVEGDATSMPFPDAHFTGAVSFTMLHHVPEPAMQDRLLAEVCRVLRPGGWFVCSDSVESDDLAALHVDDTYNPIDPATLEARLRSAGFGTAEVRTNEFAFAFRARRSTDSASVPRPKDVVRRFLDHGSTDGRWNMDVIDECFDEAYWSHTWAGDLAHTGARQGRFFSGLEFLERLESALIAEDDLVVHRSRSRFRHVGTTLGIAPTQRVVIVDHVEMWRVENGKIIEHWGGIGAAGQLHRALTVPDRP